SAVGRSVEVFIVEGQEPPEGGAVSQIEQAEQVSITPGTLQTLGSPLLQGRDFQNSELSNSLLVTIIDEPLARRSLPAGDELGKRIKTGGNHQWLTIVGIAGGVKHLGLAEEKRPHM